MKGSRRRKKIFPKLGPDTLVVKEASVTIPETKAEVVTVITKP